MRVDLHLHSYYSDGRASPAEVVEQAQAASLKIMALTDHDSMGGVAEAQAAAAQVGIFLIPAVEFTATLHGAEIHILGYFRSLRNETLGAHLRGMQAFRRQRLETAVERLRQRGLRLEVAALPVASCCESPTTFHLSQLIASRGYAASASAARRRYLGSGQGIVPSFEVTAEEVIAVIHAADGLAVWAHPPRPEFERRLAELVALGLDGVEAYNGQRGEVNASELAQKHDLVVTGGSDWHGRGAMGLEVKTDWLDRFLRRMGLGPAQGASS
ncbi:MAG: PHP domain-containing protein [Acidobacteria bacterium]|nr:PHP domain-containing protein [Acidobacteriota bacterium]